MLFVTMIILFLILPILRFILQGSVSSDLIYHWTFIHLDRLLFGSFLSLIYSKNYSRELFGKYSYLCLLLSIFGIIFCYLDASTFHYFNWIIQVFGFSAVTIFWGIVIWISIDRGKVFSSFMRFRFLRLLGKYSYFIYLVHAPVFMAASQISMPSGVFAFFTYLIVLTIVLIFFAAISFKYFEYPITVRARNFSKRRKVKFLSEAS